MKKIIFLFIIMSLNLFCEESKIKIAVYGFDSSVYKEKSIAPYTKYLETLLFDSNQFVIADRANIQKILEEQKLSASSLVDNEQNTLQLGKIIEAHYFLFGSIEQAPQGYMVTIKIVDLSKGTIAFMHSKVSTRVYNLETTIQDILKYVSIKDGTIEKSTAIIAKEKVVENENEDEFFLEMKDGSNPQKNIPKYRNYKTQLGLAFPSYGFAIQNSKGRTQGYWGPNLLAGISYKSYFSPLQAESFNFNWQAGTTFVALPYAGVGFDYLFNNGFFLGASVYGATWFEVKKVTVTKDYKEFSEEDRVDFHFSAIPAISIGLCF